MIVDAYYRKSGLPFCKWKEIQPIGLMAGSDVKIYIMISHLARVTHVITCFPAKYIN